MVFLSQDNRSAPRLRGAAWTRNARPSVPDPADAGRRGRAAPTAAGFAGLPQKRLSPYIGNEQTAFASASIPQPGLGGPGAAPTSQDYYYNQQYEEAKRQMGGREFIGRTGSEPWQAAQSAGPTGAYNMFTIPEFAVGANESFGVGWSQDKLNEWRSLGMKMGLYSPDMILTKGYWGMADAAVAAKVMGEVNATPYTDPFQWLRDEVKHKMANPDLADDGTGGTGITPTDTRHTVYSKTSIDDGRAILRAHMTDLLGRAPEDREVTSYVAALNRVEAANPQVTRNVTDAEGNSTQWLLSSEPNPEEVLRENVMDDEYAEYGEYKAQGYMDVVARLVGQ